jgi:hypothetical protein
MDEFVHLGTDGGASSARMECTAGIVRLLNNVEDDTERFGAFVAVILSVVMNQPDPFRHMVALMDSVYQAIPRAMEDRAAWLASRS